jgi:hypothetical protein
MSVETEEPMNTEALLQENDKAHVFYLHEKNTDITYSVPMDVIDAAVRNFIPGFLIEEKKQLGRYKWMVVKAAADSIRTFSELPIEINPSISSVEAMTYFFLEIILRQLRELTIDITLEPVAGEGPRNAGQTVRTES